MASPVISISFIPRVLFCSFLCSPLLVRLKKNLPQKTTKAIIFVVRGNFYNSFFRLNSFLFRLKFKISFLFLFLFMYVGKCMANEKRASDPGELG